MKLPPIKKEVKLVKLKDLEHFIPFGIHQYGMTGIIKVLTSLIIVLVQKGILDKEDIQGILNITLIED